MTAVQPLTILVSEHRLIEQVIAALEVKAETLGEQPFAREFFEGALDFLSNFASRCHLAKEEERLFPLLWEKGVPLENGPLGASMSEHEAGRRQLEAIRLHFAAAEQGSPEALAAIRSLVRDFARFARQHIRKEEQRLFNVAWTLLESSDIKRLQRDFEEVELEYPETTFHRRYEALAEHLAAAALVRPR